MSTQATQNRTPAGRSQRSRQDAGSSQAKDDPRGLPVVGQVKAGPVSDTLPAPTASSTHGKRRHTRRRPSRKAENRNGGADDAAGASMRTTHEPSSTDEPLRRSGRRRKITREADSFVGRLRRDTQGSFSVDPIGEFSTREVLRSLCQIGPPTMVRFDYKGPEEPYLLCWIDERGRKHHSYPHSGAEWSHQESSNSGHAFAIFRKRDGKLLASYRIIAALAEGQVHVVSLPELRARADTVVVEARVISELPMPPEFPSNKEWTVTYSFSVPPLPVATRPDFFETNTVYVWGDLSFDEFSLSDSEMHPIHNYRMNQIVPQVMCGECLCGSDPVTYIPYWRTFNSWVAQAQHYYQTDQGEALGSRAVCGELFAVEPGERMKTTIHFDGSKMTIRIASLDRPDQISEITTSNPFPNNTNIFPGGWSEFFRKKERSSTKTFRAYPCFNIEYKAQNADLDLLESLCPFKIHQADFPGAAADTPQKMANTWHVRGMNFLPKSGVPMVEFS